MGKKYMQCWVLRWTQTGRIDNINNYYDVYGLVTTVYLLIGSRHPHIYILSELNARVLGAWFRLLKL